MISLHVLQGPCLDKLRPILKVPNLLDQISKILIPFFPDEQTITRLYSVKIQWCYSILVES